MTQYKGVSDLTTPNVALYDGIMHWFSVSGSGVLPYPFDINSKLSTSFVRKTDEAFCCDEIRPKQGFTDLMTLFSHFWEKLATLIWEVNPYFFLVRWLIFFC